MNKRNIIGKQVRALASALLIVGSVAAGMSGSAWAAAASPSNTAAPAAERGECAAYEDGGRGFAQTAQVFTEVNVPGATSTFPTGNNEQGEIVGQYFIGNGPSHGFVRGKQGGFTTVDVPGAVETDTRKNNNKGQVVGFFGGEDGHCHGFLWSNGAFQTIDVPGAANSFVEDINNNGEMVGCYEFAPGFCHAFLRDASGNFYTIDPPGTQVSESIGINDRGQIVGAYFDSNFTAHGFLRSQNGTYTTTDVPGALAGTIATGINNHGEIVGIFSNDAQANVSHGFFRTASGTYREVTVPGGGNADIIAAGINDREQIVGASVAQNPGGASSSNSAARSRSLSLAY